MVGCPRCGMGMLRDNTPGPGPMLQQQPQAQVAAVAAQGGQQRPAPDRSGSGIIVSRTGYILSNHHVTHGAREINVTLNDGQVTKTYPAQIIDEAPDLDLVILKITAEGDEVFSPAPIGNSARLSVGDEVLAIGSPFGLQQSVTAGIISNTKRTLTVGDAMFTDLIQTDVPLNPGSSGGALVNTSGQVIGINTAIYSPDRSFSGVGFAVPIDRAVEAFPEFVEVSPVAAAGQALMGMIPQQDQGQLRPAAVPQRGPSGGSLQNVANVSGRPVLGIRVRGVNSANKATFGAPTARGVYIDEVMPGSPAGTAGLQSGDIILRVNNRLVKDEQMLSTFLSKETPGNKVKFTVFRAGSTQVFYPVMGAPSGNAVPGQSVNPADIIAGDVPPGLTGALKGGELGVGEMEALGMGVETLAPEWRIAFKIPAEIRQGVVVAEVGGLAQGAGLIAGDVIQFIDNQPVNSIEDYVAVMGQADLKNGVLLSVNRMGKRFSLMVKG